MSAGREKEEMLAKVLFQVVSRFPPKASCTHRGFVEVAGFTVCGYELRVCDIGINALVGLA